MGYSTSQPGAKTFIDFYGFTKLLGFYGINPSEEEVNRVWSSCTNSSADGGATFDDLLTCVAFWKMILVGMRNLWYWLDDNAILTEHVIHLHILSGHLFDWFNGCFQKSSGSA